MTRDRILYLFSGIGVAIATIVTVLAITAAGREQTVLAIRSGCQRTSKRNVAQINASRAQAIGDQLVATDTAEPWRTRHARADQVRKEQTLADVLDAQTDQAYWPKLDYRIDRVAVRQGINGQPPFHCDKAYPPAQLLP